MSDDCAETIAGTEQHELATGGWLGQSCRRSWRKEIEQIMPRELFLNFAFSEMHVEN